MLFAPFPQGNLFTLPTLLKTRYFSYFSNFEILQLPKGDHPNKPLGVLIHGVTPYLPLSFPIDNDKVLTPFYCVSQQFLKPPLILYSFYLNTTQVFQFSFNYFIYKISNVLQHILPIKNNKYISKASV